MKFRYALFLIALTSNLLLPSKVLGSHYFPVPLPFPYPLFPKNSQSNLNNLFVKYKPNHGLQHYHRIKPNSFRAGLMSNKEFEDHLLLLNSLRNDEKLFGGTKRMSESKSDTEKYLDWIISLK